MLCRFTPTFQATIPEVLPEKDYNRALSLSRLAYDMESLVSPMLAAALLSIISFHWLFGGTALGFVCSAALVLSVRLPQSQVTEQKAAFLKRHFVVSRFTCERRACADCWH
jgi:hypothetical protein